MCLVVFESVGLSDIHLDSHEICITRGGFAAGVLCWDRGSRFTHWVATMAHDGPWVGGVEDYPTSLQIVVEGGTHKYV